MVVLEGGAVSFERGTPAGVNYDPLATQRVSIYPPFLRRISTRPLHGVRDKVVIEADGRHVLRERPFKVGRVPGKRAARVITSAGLVPPGEVMPPDRHLPRGISLTRKRAPLGPYRRPMPRALGRTQGSGRSLIGEVPLHGPFIRSQLVSRN